MPFVFGPCAGDLLYWCFLNFLRSFDEKKAIEIERDSVCVYMYTYLYI